MNYCSHKKKEGLGRSPEGRMRKCGKNVTVSDVASLSEDHCWSSTIGGIFDVCG